MIMNTPLRLDWSLYPEYSDGPIMSNFDHVINEDIKKALLCGNWHARYPGCNFHARVWHQNDQWNAEVWRYGSYRETISADSLEDLKNDVCSIYGRE